MMIEIETIARIHNAAMQADSWNDLEKRVSDRKDPLLPKKRYKDKEYFALTVATAHTTMTGKTRENSPCPIDFPATSLKKGDVTYHLHGISHDMQHRKVIKETFGQLENAVFESDLSILYSSRGVDHPRHDEMKYLSLLDSLWMFLSPMMIVTQIKDYALFFRRQRTQSEVSSYRDIGQIRRNIMTEDGSQSDYEHVEISNVVLPDHLADNWTSFHLEDRFNRACLLRSLAIAEYIEKIAKSMGVDDLHMVMGLGHERQVAYFFENPETAEFIAQTYRPSWPIRMARKLRSPSMLLVSTSYPFVERVILRADQTIQAMDAETFSLPLTLPDGIVFGTGALIAAALYRKHKHRFTNRMYIRSLLSPKRD